MKRCVIALLFACLLFSGFVQAESTYPGTPEGAKQLLGQFLKSGADYSSLSQSLRPTREDYLAVFEKNAAVQAFQGYTSPWTQGLIVIKPNAGQSEVLLWSATSEELKKGTGNAKEFPGGYASIVSKYKPGVTLYRFKFVKPGEQMGMAYDGLTYVNNHWVIFPKPWRVIE